MYAYLCALVLCSKIENMEHNENMVTNSLLSMENVDSDDVVGGDLRNFGF
jgi:hypothetical protein